MDWMIIPAIGVTTVVAPFLLLRTDWLQSKPYWQRGGIIGAVIVALSLLFFLGCVALIPGEGGLVCVLFLPASLAGFFFYEYTEIFLGRFLGAYEVYDRMYSILSLEFISEMLLGDVSVKAAANHVTIFLHTTSLIIFSSLGALIGFVIGKIKSRCTSAL